MLLNIDVQFAVDAKAIVSQDQLREWMLGAYNQSIDNSVNQKEVEVGQYDAVIRIIEEQESQQLNHSYRGYQKPTNVLSFSYEDLQNYFGDLATCLSVVENEAFQQGKQVKDHLAHMVVHGTLHLLGYDHQDDNQATKMEALEISILDKFGIANPYSPV